MTPSTLFFLKRLVRDMRQCVLEEDLNRLKRLVRRLERRIEEDEATIETSDDDSAAIEESTRDLERIKDDDDDDLDSSLSPTDGNTKEDSSFFLPPELLVNDRPERESLKRCDDCGRSFNKPSQLKQHVFIKHRGGALAKQVCPRCGRAFEAKYLVAHIAAVHEGRRFSCDACDKSFATRSVLNKHRRAVHAGRRFSCRECPKSFVSKWGLEVHFGRDHEKRSFACDLCQSILKTETLLKRHKKTVHEKIRFACQTCSASFTQKSQLNYHSRLKHGDAGSRFACDKCNKVFVIPWKMRRHEAKCASASTETGYAEIAASLAETNQLPD